MQSLDEGRGKKVLSTGVYIEINEERRRFLDQVIRQNLHYMPT